jgi:hypothetical protein
MSAVETRTAPRPSTSAKFDRENAAFQQLRESLLDRYDGPYVAIHEGQVVDYGVEQMEVSRRCDGRWGDIPIDVGLITSGAEPVVRLPTPRCVRESGAS